MWLVLQIKINWNFWHSKSCQRKTYNRKIKMAVGSTSNCTIGIFVLDHIMRGRGYGKTLVWASCYLCCLQVGITHFEAGALKQNTASLKAFLGCGFKISEQNEVRATLELDVIELVQPESVKRVVFEENSNSV